MPLRNLSHLRALPLQTVPELFARAQPVGETSRRRVLLTASLIRVAQALYRELDLAAWPEETKEMSTKAPNLTDKHVGSRVRMRRVMLGMSQEKLGKLWD